MSEREVTTHDNSHLTRISPDVHQKYRDMISQSLRKSNDDYHCEVSLQVNTNQTMTVGAFKEHQANLEEHLENVLDNLTQANLEFIYGHIDQPIVQAISLIRDLNGWAESADTDFVESVVESLQQLLSYHRPYSSSYLKD
ncbi:MAG: hypothetical protein GY861_16500 [bacterium]|nr:hypothetical protein [bacterium]